MPRGWRGLVVRASIVEQRVHYSLVVGTGFVLHVLDEMSTYMR